MTTMPDPDHAVGGPGRGGHAHTLASVGQVADLAAWLLSPHRDRTVVVVASRTTLPDLHEVAGRLGDGVETYSIVDDTLTRRLASYLPGGSAVYGDAARIYPPAWTGAAGAAPLLSHDGPATVPELAARLADSLARVSSRPGPKSRPADPATPDREALPADGVVHHIASVTAGRDLARWLLDAHRRVPVVAVTVHPEASAPYFDAADIAEQCKGVAAVALIDADATFGLTDGLGDKRLSVFYGAARVYPVGTAWIADMYAAPLSPCFSKGQAARQAPDVVGSAFTAAAAAGLLTTDTPIPEAEHLTVKVVSRLPPHHALVEADDGRRAAMLTAQLAVGVPYDRLVSPGQRLAGRYVTGGWLGEFTPDPVPDDPLARVKAAIPDGTAALARVTDVAAESSGPLPGSDSAPPAGDPAAARARALLHPQVPLTILPDDEDLRLLLTPGDTVGIEVVWESGQAFGLLLADPSPDDLHAVSILPDGPPWLVPGDLVPERPASRVEPEPPVEAFPTEAPADGVPARRSPDRPAPEAGGDAHTLARQLHVAQDSNDLLTAALDDAQSQLDRARDTVRSLQRELRRAKGRSSRRAAAVWRHPEQQLRHEIALAYLDRIPEDDRPTWPLPARYAVGPQFVASAERLQGISRDKILDVVVEVLTGLDKQLASRERHAWLTRRGGPQDVRDDGARAWRVSLQSNSPGARRLKYWTNVDGTIELDSVGHHDDGLGSA